MKYLGSDLRFFEILVMDTVMFRGDEVRMGVIFELVVGFDWFCVCAFSVVLGWRAFRVLEFGDI